METNLQPQRPSPDSAEWLAECHAMSNEELRQLLLDGLRLTVDTIRRMAVAVHVLSERGDNLEDLNNDYIRHLRKIACGQILPEVVVQYACKTSLIKKIGNLPLDDQRKIVSGEPVKLVVFGDNGERTHRMVDPVSLRPEQVRQVFAGDHIRTEQEQHLYLDDAQTRQRKPIPERIDNVTVDKDRDGIIPDKREFITRATLKAALRALRR